MIKQTLIILAYSIRKVRRFFGFPVMDLSKSTNPISIAVREMEKQPETEK